MAALRVHHENLPVEVEKSRIGPRGSVTGYGHHIEEGVGRPWDRRIALGALISLSFWLEAPAGGIRRESNNFNTVKDIRPAAIRASPLPSNLQTMPLIHRPQRPYRPSKSLLGTKNHNGLNSACIVAGSGHENHIGTGGQERFWADDRQRACSASAG